MHTITTTDDLKNACAGLKGQPYITVDTEFMRESTYWPKLCLVQMAGPEGDAILVDAMADIDLQPFFDLMADETIVKVFHAARQDVEIVHHMAGLIPHPLFDTQVAASVCGYGESIGYEALVRQIADGAIDKSHRFTDWSRRPLSEAQLAYAAADVTFLRPVYEALAEKVEKLGRSEWIAEEMAILTSPATYRTEPEDAWKRLKMKVKKPRDLAILMELAEWREREAQTRDVPRSRVLKDDALYEVAAHAPDSEQALGRLRGVPNGYERSASGREIVAIVKRVKARPAEELPRVPRSDGARRAAGPVADLLKVLLKHVADRNRVASRLIANSEEVEALAADDEADVPALSGWRRELFGEKALALKHGRLALAVQGESLRVEDREPPARNEKRRSRSRSG
ncbi:ribonuclease D [Lutibaculum baratangense]|uniref:Ribonuclease D n=1 Tax=Lutibaculum baratangense AMV1 TaxID=631454 RepID=V4RJU4_9HYPH|nr:ribonuclease D [Lutibaculum baratangense]ESR23515.1 Ribonuclease D [Lutibaculum baratangense AMV1]